MVAARAELAALLLLIAAVCSAAGFRPGGPPSVTEDTLEKVAASLEMYVDALPQMPKVLGYSIKHGRPTPTHLTIGMYQKKWVRTYVAFAFLFIYFLNPNLRLRLRIHQHLHIHISLRTHNKSISISNMSSRKN
jgi:hypothetical protein